MKYKKEELFILFYFTQNSLQVLRWKEHKVSRKKIEDFIVVAFDSLQDKDELLGKMKEILSRIHITSEEVIVVINHQKVVSRYLHLPTQERREIEQMIYFQKSKILPYAPQEIITGYQIVDKDKEGSSFVNVVLVHQDTVRYLLDILKELNIEVDSLVLHTYGVAEFFRKYMPGEQEEIILIHLDFPNLEIAVLDKGCLCFSRFVKISQQDPNWQDEMFKKIMETQTLYLRQSSAGPIKKMYLVGRKTDVLESKRILQDKMLVPVEIIENPREAIDINTQVTTEDFIGAISGLLGFIFRRPPESLNLLPVDLKERKKKAAQVKDRLKLAVISVCVLIIGLLGFFKYIDNKKIYLSSLETQLQEVKKEASQLETMEKKLNILKARYYERLRILDFFVGLHEVIPAGVFIREMDYNAQIQEEFSIKGTASRHELVFRFASDLKELVMFSDNEIKVKYATSKVTREGEIINFEILFLRRNDYD